MELMSKKADTRVYEGEGGAYHSWLAENFELLKELKLGAGKLLLHPLGFAFPHYSDSSKIGYVVQGMCKVGLVAPNGLAETVVEITKGDIIPVQRGVVSWWLNSGQTDLTIVFIGETTKALKKGAFANFFMGGYDGILNNLPKSISMRVFDLSEKEVDALNNDIARVMIDKLSNGTEFPEPSRNVRKNLYATIEPRKPDVVVRGGGTINSLTGEQFSMLGEMGLSARFVRLEGKAILSPSYLADGACQIIYVAKGTGEIQAVNNDGDEGFYDDVREGELIVVPQFFVVTAVAYDGGMELFSIIYTSKPVFVELAGEFSVWKALSPEVLQFALNISHAQTIHLRIKNTGSMMIIPP